MPCCRHPYNHLSTNIHRQLFPAPGRASNCLWQRSSSYRHGLVLYTRGLSRELDVLHCDNSDAPAHCHCLCKLGWTVDATCSLGRRWRTRIPRGGCLGKLKEAGEDGLKFMIQAKQTLRRHVSNALKQEPSRFRQ